MSQETNNKEVVAVVAGEEITQEEFNLFLQAVPRAAGISGKSAVPSAVSGSVHRAAAVCEVRRRVKIRRDRRISDDDRQCKAGYPGSDRNARDVKSRFGKRGGSRCIL